MSVDSAVSRDLCDMRATCSEIEIDLKYAGKALGDAYGGERDEAESIAAVLELLRSAHAALSVLIAEVEAAR